MFASSRGANWKLSWSRTGWFKLLIVERASSMCSVNGSLPKGANKSSHPSWNLLLPYCSFPVQSLAYFSQFHTLKNIFWIHLLLSILPLEWKMQATLVSKKPVVMLLPFFFFFHWVFSPGPLTFSSIIHTHFQIFNSFCLLRLKLSVTWPPPTSSGSSSSSVPFSLSAEAIGFPASNWV